MKTWHIKDWAGNLMFKGTKFRTFDAAEEYLIAFLGAKRLDYAENRGEYYIQEVQS